MSLRKAVCCWNFTITVSVAGLASYCLSPQKMDRDSNCIFMLCFIQKASHLRRQQVNAFKKMPLSLLLSEDSYKNQTCGVQGVQKQSGQSLWSSILLLRPDDQLHFTVSTCLFLLLSSLAYFSHSVATWHQALQERLDLLSVFHYRPRTGKRDQS